MFFRFNVGIEVSIQFQKEGSPALDSNRVFESNSPLLQGWVVSLEEKNQFVLTERVKARWEEESTESDNGLFPL